MTAPTQHSEQDTASDIASAAKLHAGVSDWYDAHAADLLAFLAARTSNLDVARDLAQEVWASVWTRAAEFDGQHLRGWLFQIARNKLIDWQRQRQEQPMTDETAARLTANDVTDDSNDERLAEVRSCVELLDPTRRSVVEARLRGESFDTISQQTGTPVKTAMTQFHRAKQQLKECLERRVS